MRDPREKYLAQITGGPQPHVSDDFITQAAPCVHKCAPFAHECPSPAPPSPASSWSWPRWRPWVVCLECPAGNLYVIHSFFGAFPQLLILSHLTPKLFLTLYISDPVAIGSSDQFCSKFSTRLSQLSAWVPVVLLFLSFFLFLSWIISHECEVLTSHICKHSSRRPSHTHGPQWHWDRLVSVTSGS